MAIDTSPPARSLTPLWVISLFVTLTEVMTGVAATQTMGGVQIAFTSFVIVFPSLIATAFFAILWRKPEVFYPPGEWKDVDIQKYVDAVHRRDVVQAAAVSALPEVLEKGVEEFKNSPADMIAVFHEQLRKLPQFQIAEPSAPKPELDSPSVLWVDDKPSNNEYEASVLRRLGAKITSVRSTAEALALLHKDKFDLVISDIHRDEDGQSRPNAGYELLDALQDRIPVIFYTGDVSRLNKQRARNARGVADAPKDLIDLVLNEITEQKKGPTRR